MNHIIITKEQSQEIKGEYGTQRSDGTYPAKIEPVQVPDGTFIIPESCLNGFGLESVKAKLESLIKPDNIQEIKDLPKMGEQCIKDKLYKYSEGTEEGYNGLVKCVQTHIRTEHKVQDIPALFSFFRDNSDTLEWIPNEKVDSGWKRMFNGIQYECIQAHMTLENWTPTETIGTLWKSLAPATGEWKVGVSYKVDDMVTYQSNTYKCLQAHTSQAGWTPPAVPALWQLQ